MLKTKIHIQFKNINQLWEFARKINAVQFEINTADRVLICDCSEEDLSLLGQFDGKIIEEYTPGSPRSS
jgi:hypothetical protein